jgi:hypothetical protein
LNGAAGLSTRPQAKLTARATGFNNSSDFILHLREARMSISQGQESSIDKAYVSPFVASDEEEPDQWPACKERCSHSGCTKTCCKTATPAHQAYGIHACSDHK